MTKTNVFENQDTDHCFWHNFVIKIVKQVTLAGDLNAAPYKRSDFYVCMLTVYFGTKLF